MLTAAVATGVVVGGVGSGLGSGLGSLLPPDLEQAAKVITKTAIIMDIPKMYFFISTGLKFNMITGTFIRWLPGMKCNSIINFIYPAGTKYGDLLMLWLPRLTHPGYAALAHPLSASGKRV